MGSNSETTPRQRTVAVVGAGASGLVAAKRMLDAGFDVTIYEYGSHIGGLWVFDNDSGLSAAYKTLYINTDKNVTSFTDFPLPDSASIFPHHSEMRRYLDSYADTFGLRERVLFKTPVTRVSPVTTDQGGAAWNVTDANGGSRVYDIAIIASGHQSTARHPEFAADFTGEYLHSHEYREPARFVGKRICVVGGGNSACDIAADVCVTAERTVMAVRSGVKILPKLVFGVPLTRLYSLIGRPWVPQFVLRRTMQLITRVLHGDIRKLGFMKADSGVHPSSHATLISHVAYRRIDVKPGIRRVEGQRIEFTDGTAEEFDTLIAATGYLIDVPIIPSDVIDIREGHVPLFKRVVPLDWPGLYFIGLLQYQGPFFKAFDLQATWVAAIETGRCALPSRERMEADIVGKQRHNAARFHNSPRHYLEEESLTYTRELREQMDGGRKAHRRLSRRSLTPEGR